MSWDNIKLPTPEERKKLSAKNQELINARQARYHRVFVQNEDGRKILEEWMQTFMFGGFTQDDGSGIAHAKSEARREFVAMVTSMLKGVD